MTLIICMQPLPARVTSPFPVTRKSNSLPPVCHRLQAGEIRHLPHHGEVEPYGQHWRIRSKPITFALDSTPSKWQWSQHIVSPVDLATGGGGRRFEVVAADEPLPQSMAPNVAHNGVDISRCHGNASQDGRDGLYATP